MKNGKIIATVVSLFVFVALIFGGYFILESKFCSVDRATASERSINDNATAIEQANKRIDQQTIKDYRRQIRELEYEYGSRDAMPVKIRQYYDWLKDELDRLIQEQKG